jgi:hypothetical protein
MKMINTDRKSYTFMRITSDKKLIEKELINQ